MGILRVFCNPIDLSIPGGTFTTDVARFDNTRVTGAFYIGPTAAAAVDHVAAAGTTTWYHFRWISTNNNINNDGTTFQALDASGNTVARMNVVNGSPTFSSVGDTTATSAVQTITIGTIYSIDMSVDVTPTNITVNGYINNVLVGTQQQTVNTVGGKGKPVRGNLITTDHQYGNYFSEGIIADIDTRGFRVRELRPQSFGVDQAWAGAVNDVVDGDLATGLSTATTDARTSFGVSNLQNISAGDIVNRIVAQTYAQRGATGLTRFNHYFRYPDATRQDAADITVSTTGQWFITEFLTNPKTSSPWVPGDLAGIQLGLRART